MATAPATKRLPNIKGWVYDNEDSYCRVEDEESREMVTDAYDPAKTYKKGETSIQDNKLYRAKADITTAEIWTPNHWEETSLETIRAEMAAEISKANSDISALNAKIIYRDISFTGSVAGNDDKGFICNIPSGYSSLSVTCISDLNNMLSNNGFLTSPVIRDFDTVCRWKNLVSTEVNISATIRFYFISNM